MRKKLKRTGTLAVIACIAWLGYVRSQWPVKEFESLIPAGKVIRTTMKDGSKVTTIHGPTDRHSGFSFYIDEIHVDENGELHGKPAPQ